MEGGKYEHKFNIWILKLKNICEIILVIFPSLKVVLPKKMAPFPLKICSPNVKLKTPKNV